MTRNRLSGFLALIVVLALAGAYGYRVHGVGYAIWFTVFLLLLEGLLLFLYRRRKRKSR